MRDYLDYSPPSLCQFLAGLTTSQAILGSAGISGATSLAGGKKGANAATQAAQIQAQAAQAALQFEEGVYAQGQQQLAPYIQFGTNFLQNQLPGIVQTATTPIDLSIPQWTPTMAGLEQTPGYQFTQYETLNAIQGRGGVPTANAATLAGDLASTTYQQQYGNYLAQVQNVMALNSQKLQQNAQIYNAGMGAAGVGSTAIGMGLGQAAALTPQIASAAQNVGAAQASGVVGAANALTGGLAGVGGAATNAATLLALTGGNAATAAGATPLTATQTAVGDASLFG